MCARGATLFDRELSSEPSNKNSPSRDVDLAPPTAASSASVHILALVVRTSALLLLTGRTESNHKHGTGTKRVVNLPNADLHANSTNRSNAITRPLALVCKRNLSQMRLNGQPTRPTQPLSCTLSEHLDSFFSSVFAVNPTNFVSQWLAKGQVIIIIIGSSHFGSRPVATVPLGPCWRNSPGESEG